MKKTILILALIVICSATVLAQNMGDMQGESMGGMSDSMEMSMGTMSILHLTAVVLAAIAVALGVMSAKGKGKTAVLILAAGVAAFGLIHLTEFFVEILHVIDISEGGMMTIEHVLSYVGFILFGIGFLKMK